MKFNELKNALGECSDMPEELSLSAKSMPRKKQTRFPYKSAMDFLAAQVVKEMQRIGHPARVHTVYRSPEDQDKKKQRGVSRASAWDSPHQFYLASDIIHEKFAWFEGRPDAECLEFFTALNKCWIFVAEKYDVDLVYGYDWNRDPEKGRPMGWDPAHVEFRDWRDWANSHGNQPLDDDDLKAQFLELLPEVLVERQKQRLRCKAGEARKGLFQWLARYAKEYRSPWVDYGSPEN